MCKQMPTEQEHQLFPCSSEAAVTGLGLAVVTAMLDMRKCTPGQVHDFFPFLSFLYFFLFFSFLFFSFFFFLSSFLYFLSFLSFLSLQNGIEFTIPKTNFCFVLFCFVLFCFVFCFLETGFLCVVLDVLELTL